MGETKIEWTDATLNLCRGCTPKSKGCTNCYACLMAHRFSGPGQPYEGLTRQTTQGPKWTGEVRLVEEDLDKPFHWRKPRHIFLNSMSDTFHADVPFSFIDRIWAMMALTPQHTYQVLTKRPERMLEYLTHPELYSHVLRAAGVFRDTYPELGAVPVSNPTTFPLKNAWIGTSVEDQEAADKRIPCLLQVPAAVRFLSCEPLLGPVDVDNIKPPGGIHSHVADMPLHGRRYWTNGVDVDAPRIHWVICGGESGPKARPMHPDWARSLRDQCQAAGVPFFFKQWGSWVPAGRQCGGPDPYSPKKPNYSPEQLAERPASEYANGRPYRFVEGPGGATIMVNVGKKIAGRILDGVLWDQMPERR